MKKRVWLIIILGVLLLVGAGYIFIDLDEVIVCEENQRNVDACTADYTPVCAKVRVVCVAPPCDPIDETYPNSCSACSNEKVVSYKKGEC